MAETTNYATGFGDALCPFRQAPPFGSGRRAQDMPRCTLANGHDGDHDFGSDDDATAGPLEKPVGKLLAMAQQEADALADVARAKAADDAAEQARQALAARARERARRDGVLAKLDVPLEYERAFAHALEYVDALSLDRVAPAMTDAQLDRLRRKREAAESFVERWPTRREDATYPHLVVAYGGFGTGKTLTGWALTCALVDRHGADVEAVEFADMVRQLRGGWQRGHVRDDDVPDSERRVLRRLRRREFLFVNEASRHAFGGDARAHLFDVVAWRQERGLPTYVTTNARTRAELTALIGEPLFSRLAGHGQTWDFGDFDQRPYRAGGVA